MATEISPEAQAFLETVDAFLASTGMSDTAFGLWAMNDHKFLHSVRAGKRDPRWHTRRKVERKIAERLANEGDAA